MPILSRPLPELTNQDIDRFWSHVDKSAPNGCWLFDKDHDPTRYGRSWMGKSDFPAHRIAYLIAHGIDPGELLVLHRCDVLRCVNPAHLFLGDAKANINDCKAKGRLNTPAGERHGTKTRPDRVARGEKRSPLTGEQVTTIRAEYTSGRFTHQELADQFGIHREAIGAIVRGLTWRHIPVPDADAVRRVTEANRAQRGEASPNAVLTADLVRDIRRRYAAGNTTHARLAAEIGVSVATVAHVVQRRSWRHVD